MWSVFPDLAQISTTPRKISFKVRNVTSNQIQTFFATTVIIIITYHLKQGYLGTHYDNQFAQNQGHPG